MDAKMAWLQRLSMLKARLWMMRLHLPDEIGDLPDMDDLKVVYYGRDQTVLSFGTIGGGVQGPH